MLLSVLSLVHWKAWVKLVQSRQGESEKGLFSQQSWQCSSLWPISASKAGMFMFSQSWYIRVEFYSTTSSTKGRNRVRAEQERDGWSLPKEALHPSKYIEILRAKASVQCPNIKTLLDIWPDCSLPRKGTTGRFGWVLFFVLFGMPVRDLFRSPPITVKAGFPYPFFKKDP